MSFDTAVPERLKQTQEWFASILASPIDVENNISPVSPRGLPIEVEASEYIESSRTLAPHQRMELYSRQYWWRLLSVLQEDFPLIVRLFGYTDFNQKIAIPYLLKYPPRSWTLAMLGDRMVKWIEEDYRQSDQELIKNAAQIDWAFNMSFTTSSHPPINEELMKDTEVFFEKKLSLQPHVVLFELPYDLFTCRRDFLEHDPDFWLERDFPALPKGKTHHFILFRTLYNDIKWEEISHAEYYLLNCFQKGASLDQICHLLEKEQSDLARDASKKFHLWLQKWVATQLLTQHDHTS